MKILSTEEAYRKLQKRSFSNESVYGEVSRIINTVRTDGDRGLEGIALTLKDPKPAEFVLAGSREEIEEEALSVLQESAANIVRFAAETAKAAASFSIQYQSHTAGLRWQPVNTAGCYVPGGRFPLASTALMTISAAKAAGVKNIVVCSPDSSPEILAACEIAGAHRFFNAGGAQAIAAMAFGTETIPRVDVIAGPGNIWVTEAKKQLQGRVGIDMLAGPSEIAVVVNTESDTAHTVMDLLAQAEHDPEASCWCVTLSDSKGEEVTRALATKSSEMGITIGTRINFVKAASIEIAATFCNELAPEHLQLSLKTNKKTESLFKNYGALFIGPATSVPMGDYSAGPNHTLPTGGTARFAGGLTPLTFMRPQSYVMNYGDELPKLSAGFASLEGLSAHRLSCTLRVNREEKPL